jgi:hypothetical protein
LGAALSKQYQVTISPVEISKRLEEITAICHAMDLPLLSALVVKRETYQPDERFYKQYEELKGIQAFNKKEIHVSEVKKIMGYNKWQLLLERLSTRNTPDQFEKQVEHKAIQVVQESTIASELPTEESFIAKKDKLVKDAIALGPVLRRDQLQEVQQPIKRQVIKTVYDVNAFVIAEVMYRANGICESCGHLAPFYRKDDYSPYLEITYKIPFEKGGEDSVKNAIAVCPNCHMKKRYGS